MGISRSVGLGLFLLFTVSFFAGGSYESLREKEQQRFLKATRNKLDLAKAKRNHYDLDGPQKSFNVDAVVGEKLVFLFRAKEVRADGKFTDQPVEIYRHSSSLPLRIGEPKRLCSFSSNDLGDVYSIEVVPLEPGDKVFHLLDKTVNLKVVLRNVAFINHSEEVEAKVNQKLTLYGTYNRRDTGYTVDRTKTDSSLTVTDPIETYHYLQVPYFDLPVQIVEVTPTRAGSFDLHLEYRWFSEGSVQKQAMPIRIVVS